jgi:plastocyanin
MWQRFVMVAAISIAAATSSADAWQKPKPRPVTHRVTIDATSFEPATVTIRAGDSVVWMNRDIIPHTATQTGKGFDSGTLKSGDAWKHTFKTAGDVAYVCTFHPTMKGTVKVQ